MPFFTKKEGCVFVRRKLPSKLLVAMKLSFVLMLVTTLQVSAISHAQTITADYNKAAITTVLDDLRKKTGYNTFYRGDRLAGARPVTAKFTNTPLAEVLKKISEGQPFEMRFNGTAIVVRRRDEPDDKNGSTSTVDVVAEVDISGRILTEDGRPIAGATIQVKGGRQAVVSDEEGRFRLIGVSEKAVIVVSFVGYESKELTAAAAANGELDIRMKVKASDLDEVVVRVNTGYEELPIERVNGSVVTIDNKLFNRRISGDVLSRLNGVANGVYFNPPNTAGSTRTGIVIRGQNTISGLTTQDPLIVVDNFPFEGDLASLNPNDIESVTVLRDAASASIWGARSANGVIVITTKKGAQNRPLRLGFTSAVTVAGKPDVYYDRKFVSAKDYIDIEKVLFDGGYYNGALSDNVTYPGVSPVIEIYQKVKEGKISQADADPQLNYFRSKDVRPQFGDYIYRKSVTQQYAVNVSGGSSTMTYYFGVGFDKDKPSLVNNDIQRITLTSANSYFPIKSLEINSKVTFSQNKTDANNSLGWGGIASSSGSLYSYADLVDENGFAASIVKDHRIGFVDSLASIGFLDWHYRPLDEIANSDRRIKNTTMLLQVGLRYKIAPWLKLDFQFQNERNTGDDRNYQSEKAYNTRNLINLFSLYNPVTNVFTYQVPRGGIFRINNSSLTTNNGRGTLNFNKTFGNHMVAALAGMEIRETKTEAYSRLSYGYNPENGTSTNGLNFSDYLSQTGGWGGIIPSLDGNIRGTTQRFLSYFANAYYSYRERYSVSISGRRDGSNIFGVKTNDRITPLWSAALGWEVSKEPFYNVAWLEYAKLRASYGWNGNVYNGGAYLTASFLGVSSITNFNYGTITSPPNPQLRWEKVRNINIGIDYRLKDNVISGSIQLYKKTGVDLIEDIPLASSTGFTSFKGNAAATTTTGADVTLTTRNLRGNFSWTTDALFSWVKEKVGKLSVQKTALDLASFTTGATYGGGAVRGIYSFEMAGIDPETGDPLGYVNKSISKDYTTIVTRTSPDSLTYHGSARPQFFGALRNSFSFKGFTLSANITYAFKYFFRRPTVDLSYQKLLQGGLHSDYTKRWTKPGDELNSFVPSMSYATNDNRSILYKFSQHTIERGDHVRIQDISFGYDFGSSHFKRLPFSNVQLYFYANNIGVLWKANKAGLDPNYTQDFMLPAVKSYSFSIRVSY